LFISTAKQKEYMISRMNFPSMRLLSIMLMITCLISSQAKAKIWEDEGDKARSTISGHVKDSETGEDLIGATIYISELKSGTVTNTYGYYSLKLDEGTYTITFSYIGYASSVHKIELQEDITLDIELTPQGEQLREVEITDHPANPITYG
jgi:hypothetical protein